VQLSQFFTSLVRAFRWHRRWFAAAFAAIALFAAINVIASRTGGSTPVVVAARSIPGGTTLSAADLSVVWLPAAVAAEGAFDSTDSLIGQEVAAPISKRSPVTTATLLSGGAEVAPGKVALPVRFGDASAAAILQVGCHLDVLGPSAGQGGFSVVAADVRVIAIPNGGQSGSMTGRGGELVLIEVDQSQAAVIAAAASATELSYALR
jgi:Flp pilus assembly protein CpaB